MQQFHTLIRSDFLVFSVHFLLRESKRKCNCNDYAALLYKLFMNCLSTQGGGGSGPGVRLPVAPFWGRVRRHAHWLLRYRTRQIRIICQHPDPDKLFMPGSRCISYFLVTKHWRLKFFLITNLEFEYRILLLGNVTCFVKLRWQAEQ